ncbi:MAG: phosphoribosylglycinamide formyltransferase [Actinobacteria bacterium]|nr:phosphoribosylglycinamide formyltransferase [Actinomycetota bacterium]
MRLCVLASGSGTNLQAIIDACEKGFISANVVKVISNKKDAYALERARQKGIPSKFIDPKSFRDRKSYDEKIAEEVEEAGADLIVLAGYMLLLTPEFVKRYPYRITNIHPALCPAFPGTHAIKDAIEYRVKVTGVTVHFVDEGMDTGPIILQYPVFVEDDDTVESLEEKIHKVEHKLYPLALRLISLGQIDIQGRHIKILDKDWKKYLEGDDLPW